MCLNWDEVQQQSDSIEDSREEGHERLKAAHKDVSCAGTYLVASKVGGSAGGVLWFQSIPVTGACCVVFPINPRDSAKLTPCATTECIAAQCDGTINPHKYTKYIERENTPQYRSFGVYRSLGDDQPTQLENAPLKVFENPDGGAVALIPAAKYIPGNLTPEQRAELGPQLLACIRNGLAKANIEPTRVFGAAYNEDDESSSWGFLGFLFDAVTPGCDIVIGIVPPGQTSGRFTFAFYDEELGAIPALGLIHGEQAADGITVDEDFFVILADFAPSQLRLKGANGESDAVVTLRTPEECTQDYFAIEAANDDDLNGYEVRYRGTHTHGNWMWQTAQKEFQRPLVQQIKNLIDNFAKETIDVTKAMTYGRVSAIRLANLKGMRIPDDVVDATIERVGAHQGEATIERVGPLQIDAEAIPTAYAVIGRGQDFIPSEPQAIPTAYAVIGRGNGWIPSDDEDQPMYASMNRLRDWIPSDDEECGPVYRTLTAA